MHRPCDRTDILGVARAHKNDRQPASSRHSKHPFIVGTLATHTRKATKKRCRPEQAGLTALLCLALVSLAVVVLPVDLAAVGVLLPVHLLPLLRIHCASVGCPVVVDLLIHPALPSVGPCGFARGHLP